MSQHIIVALEDETSVDADFLGRHYNLNALVFDRLKEFVEAADEPIGRITLIGHSTDTVDTRDVTMKMSSDIVSPEKLASKLQETGVLKHLRSIDLISCTAGLLAHRYSQRGSTYYSAYFPEHLARSLYEHAPHVVVKSLTNHEKLSEQRHATILVSMSHSAAVPCKISLLAFPTIQASDSYYQEVNCLKGVLDEIRDQYRTKYVEYSDIKKQISSLKKHCCASIFYYNSIMQLGSRKAALELELRALVVKQQKKQAKLQRIMKECTLFESEDALGAFDAHPEFYFYACIEAEALKVLGERLLSLQQGQAYYTAAYPHMHLNPGAGAAAGSGGAGNLGNATTRLIDRSLTGDKRTQADLLLLKRTALCEVDRIRLRAMNAQQVEPAEDDADDDGAGVGSAAAAAAAAAAAVPRAVDAEDVQQANRLHGAIVEKFGSDWLAVLEKLKDSDDEVTQDLIDKIEQRAKELELDLTDSGYTPCVASGLGIAC